MAICQTTTETTYRVICATICEKKNDAPIALYMFENYLLVDMSEYFDDQNDTNRQVKWEIYVDDFLVYDFGFGNYNDPITELSNGSIYSVLNLGNENEEIIDFLESLPTTFITNDVTLEVRMTVKDNTGVQSENFYTSYKFNKFI